MVADAKSAVGLSKYRAEDVRKVEGSSVEVVRVKASSVAHRNDGAAV